MNVKDFPTMKPLDSDKKVSKEVSAPVAAAQALLKFLKKLIFPMWRSSRCLPILWTLTRSASPISVL